MFKELYVSVHVVSYFNNYWFIFKIGYSGQCDFLAAIF